MKVPCKNVQCKHYYSLVAGEHCTAEDQCREYTSNRKRAEEGKIKCNECEYCKVMYTNGWKEYHYECTYKNRGKLLLLLEKRKCDCRN